MQPQCVLEYLEVLKETPQLMTVFVLPSAQQTSYHCCNHIHHINQFSILKHAVASYYKEKNYCGF